VWDCGLVFVCVGYYVLVDCGGFDWEFYDDFVWVGGVVGVGWGVLVGVVFEDELLVFGVFGDFVGIVWDDGGVVFFIGVFGFWYSGEGW